MTDGPEMLARNSDRSGAASSPADYAAPEPVSCTVLHRRHLRRHPAPVFSRPEGRM